VILEKIPDFITAMAGKKILALDVSKNNIGLAVADARMKIASPIGSIERKNLKYDLAELQKIISENNIGGLVIGLPLNMDGSEGPRCQSVRQFARDILKAIKIQIIFFDERLSTFASAEILDESGFTRQKKRGLVDSGQFNFTGIAGSLLIFYKNSG